MKEDMGERKKKVPRLEGVPRVEQYLKLSTSSVGIHTNSEQPFNVPFLTLDEF